MQPIQLKFQRSFYIRHGLIGGTSLLICLVMMLALRHVGLWVLLAPVLFFCPWLFFVLREYRNAAWKIDEGGVTRYDGRRFSWSDLKKVREVRMVLAHGQTGPLNHVDIVFTNGIARILPMALENGFEAIQSVQNRKKPQEKSTQAATTHVTILPARKNLPAKAPPPSAPPGSTACSICSKLGDYHRGSQKHAHEDEETFLPKLGERLKIVRDVHPGKTRSPVLEQCPECGAWFLFEATYEYFADGSEEDQILRRITAEEAEKILKS